MTFQDDDETAAEPAEQDPSAGPSLLASYRELFYRLTDCACIVDPQTYQIVEVNFACERTWGVSSDDLVQKPLLKLFDGEKREEIKKALRISMRRYYPRVFESVINPKEGSTFLVEIQACPLRLSNEQELLQIIIRDITAKKRAENKVKELLNELTTANQKLQLLSTTDEMTGLFNYRFFKVQLEKDHDRAQRYGSRYSLVFFDIDHFKNYNDHNGHPAGDRLLVQFAEVLKSSCRFSDFPARYGGEEFVVICAEVGSEGAKHVAERVRAKVEKTRFEFSQFQPSGKVTVSVGVASYPEDGLNPEAILAAADRAVYFSKRNGRNQVTLASTLQNETESDDSAA